MYDTITPLIKNKLNHIEHVKVTYIGVDDMYIIEPHYEYSDTIEIFKTDKNFRGMLLDEHGKLILSFIYTHFNTTFKYRKFQTEKEKKAKFFESNSKYDTGYIIEDYKLKKLISRMIHIIEAYNVKPKKHERGSTELEHLLWMLHAIYSQDKFLTKRYNWLGFIQGVLVCKNIIDINHERDIMREIL